MTGGPMTEGRDQRRDRLWVRRLFTLAGGGVLVWMYFETLAAVEKLKSAEGLTSVLLALVTAIAAICTYYVKRRADAEKEGRE